MKKLTPYFLGLASMCAIACQPQSDQKASDGKLSEAEIEARINEILPQLSIEEKSAMCHAQSKFSTPGVARLGIPELWWSDGPHGVRAEINWNDWGYAGWNNDSCTAFPALSALAATFNPDLAYIYGVALGEESRYRKKNVILGPGVNIYRTPLNGRNFEYMGEDPFLASTLVVPYIHGVQSTGTATSVKHYALNNQEDDRMGVNVQVSERALRELYLPAFKAAVVDGGAWTIMGSYNRYNNQHCCHNEILLMDILKKEWNFDGVVVSDWGGVHDTKEAARFGLDVEMGSFTNGLDAQLGNFSWDDYNLAKPYINAIKKGELPVADLDDKARRILRLNFRTNNGWGPGRMTCPDHMKTAHDVAQEAVTLLKNEGAVLPLDPAKKLTIAVIGENATRTLVKAGGSSELKPKYEIAPLDGIRNEFPNANIEYATGYTSGPAFYGFAPAPKEDQAKLKAEAVELAQKADLVIYVGGLNKNYQQDCEGGDRTAYELPFNQDALISALADVNKNMVVVLASGNAYSMPWIDKVPAVVQAWHLGSESGNVVAEVLCGKINPSGKLPFSFPVKLEDSAPHSFNDPMVYPGVDHQEIYKEDILVGYRWHDTKGIKPLFPFGFGLSYTTFDVKDIKVSNTASNINVSANIANTGNVNGAEVLQVYVGKVDSKVARAQKELKGFQKLAVNKGASANANISIPVESLKFYNEETKAWELEKGKYVVYVGTSSADILSTTEIEL